VSVDCEPYRRTGLANPLSCPARGRAANGPFLNEGDGDGVDPSKPVQSVTASRMVVAELTLMAVIGDNPPIFAA